MKKTFLFLLLITLIPCFLKPATIKVNKPDGTKPLCKGEKCTIEWVPYNRNGFVEIYLRSSDGKRNIEVLAEHTRDDGIHESTIPAHVSDGYYRIGVVCVEDHNIFGNSKMVRVIGCLKKKGKTMTLNKRPVHQLQPATVKPLQFSKLDHGEVEITSIQIQYGQNTVIINQSGGQAGISIPETSGLLNSNGHLPVKFKYTLRNKTSKRFNFTEILKVDPALLAPNNPSSFSQRVTLFQNQSKSISHDVILKNCTQYKEIQVYCPEIGISDDTLIIFFNGRLMVHIYAL